MIAFTFTFDITVSGKALKGTEVSFLKSKKIKVEKLDNRTSNSISFQPRVTLQLSVVTF